VLLQDAAFGALAVGSNGLVHGSRKLHQWWWRWWSSRSEWARQAGSALEPSEVIGLSATPGRSSCQRRVPGVSQRNGRYQQQHGLSNSSFRGVCHSPDGGIRTVSNIANWITLLPAASERNPVLTRAAKPGGRSQIGSNRLLTISGRVVVLQKWQDNASMVIGSG
jgi:hypothetical protein